MSVLDRREDAEWERDDDFLYCFFCGSMITEFPAIHWCGAQVGHIYFHPKCMMNFNIRTTVDVYVAAQRLRLDEDLI